MKFFNKLKVGQKLILNISILLILVILLVSYVLFEVSKMEFTQKVEEKLHIINDLKIEKINAHFKNLREGVKTFEGKTLVHELDDYIIHYNTDNDSLKSLLSLEEADIDEQLKTVQKQYNLDRVLLFSPAGDLLFTSKETHILSKTERGVLFKKEYNINTITENGPVRPLFEDAKHDVVFSGRFNKDNFRDDFIMLLGPIFNENHDIVSIIGFEIGLRNIHKLISDTIGLGYSGETLLTQRTADNHIDIFGYSNDKHSRLKKSGISYIERKDAPTGQPVRRSIQKGKYGFESKIIDYRGVEVDAAWSYIPELHWGIVTKIDHAEAFESINKLKGIATILGVICILIAIGFVSVYINRFMKPIIHIRNNMLSLAQGKFPKKIFYNNFDEIYDTTNALNSLVSRLKISTEFAQKIGKGDLKAEFKSSKANDVLSKALISMRGSLIELEEDNQKRKWATEGIAIHADVLRKNSDNIQSLSKALLSTLVNYVGAHHGGLYTVSYETIDRYEDDQDQTNTYYTLSATYAYDIKSYTPIKFKIGQGLIGQCALERKTIYLRETPLAFSKITSGLGEASAGYVLLIPLRVNKEVLGVLEIASFTPIEKYKIDFVEKLGDSIASSILSVTSSEKTKELLKESEMFTQDLEKREQELLENQSRMIDKNLELKITLDKTVDERDSLSDENHKLRRKLFEIEKLLDQQTKEKKK